MFAYTHRGYTRLRGVSVTDTSKTTGGMDIEDVYHP